MNNTFTYKQIQSWNLWNYRNHGVSKVGKYQKWNDYGVALSIAHNAINTSIDEDTVYVILNDGFVKDEFTL